MGRLTPQGLGDPKGVNYSGATLILMVLVEEEQNQTPLWGSRGGASAPTSTNFTYLRATEFVSHFQMSIHTRDDSSAPAYPNYSRSLKNDDTLMKDRIPNGPNDMNMFCFEFFIFLFLSQWEATGQRVCGTEAKSDIQIPIS